MITIRLRSIFATALAVLAITNSSVGAHAQATARIAFQALVTVKSKGPSASYNQIFSMNPDGTGVTQLTSAATQSTEPRWSPGQGYIAFARNGYLAVMEAKGETAGGRSFNVVPATSWGSDWSPDGSMICFTGTNGVRGLWIVSLDAATGTVGTPAVVRAGEIYWPSWSPDGTRIAFCASDDGGTTQVIKVHELSSGAEVTFSVGPTGSYNFTPAWSPDGVRIAFTGPVTTTTTGRGGKQTTTTLQQIFVANADGTGITRAVNFSTDCSWPTWSPDGTTMAFNSSGIYKTVLGSNVATLIASVGGSANWNP